MKSLPRTSALAAFLATVSLVAVSFAGPGPQFWNKSAPPAPSTPTAPVAAKCGGCSTTTAAPSTDLGPNGRGAHDAAIANTVHSCSLCSGAIATTKGQTKDTVTRAAACGTMLCCK